MNYPQKIPDDLRKATSVNMSRSTARRIFPTDPPRMFAEIAKVLQNHKEGINDWRHQGFPR
jgi:hypothetical protein